MKKTKEYNNGIDVSKFRLKPGETRIFRIRGIKKDPDYPGRMLIPAAVIVPSKDTIFVKGEPIDIACIRSIGRNKQPVFYDIIFQKETLGTITVRGGIAADQAIYEYLMLSNYRGNNPNRDQSKRAMFDLLEPEVKAKARNKNRMATLRALEYLNNLDDNEIKTLALAKNMNDDVDVEILKDQLGALAEKDPEGFLKSATNRNNTIKADVARAIKKGIIVWNKQTSSFNWGTNGALIVNIPRSSKGTHLDGFLNYVVNNDRGELVYDEIKSILSGNGPVIEIGDDEHKPMPVPKDIKTEAPNPVSDIPEVPDIPDIPDVNTESKKTENKPISRSRRQPIKPIVTKSGSNKK